MTGPSWLYDPRGLFHVILGLFGVDQPPGWLTNGFPRRELLGLAVRAEHRDVRLHPDGGLHDVGHVHAAVPCRAAEHRRPVNEAAALDGATEWRKFRLITVPMIRPTIFTVVTLGLIGTWQVFDQIYVGTKGSPSNTTLTPAFLSFNSSFNSNNWGVGAAIAFILFAIIVFFTVVTRLATRSPDHVPRRRRFGPTQPLGTPDASRVASGEPGAHRERRDCRRRRRLERALSYSVLVAIAVVYIFPFVIAIATAFKTEPDATADPLSLVPSPFTTAAFHELYKDQDFLSGCRTRRS